MVNGGGVGGVSWERFLLNILFLEPVQRIVNLLYQTMMLFSQGESPGAEAAEGALAQALGHFQVFAGDGTE
jgi:hypothetical protein